MGADFRGDPASAMLEVLDPAQNSTFRDHYLDVPFDLSDVLFIATANVLDPIPPPLQDRMEMIQLAGYTIDEKLHIAKKYLVPRQLEANGLKPSQIEVADPAMIAVIEEYTREAGRPQPRAPDRHGLPQGRPPGRRGQGGRQGQGLGQASPRAAGQAPRLLRAPPPHQGPGRRHRPRLDPVGGEVLFVEATAMPGDGKLTITGQLGDVMRESAQAALTYVRGHVKRDRRRAGRRLVREPRHPHPRARRRGAQGRPLGGRRDGDRARLAGRRQADRQRRRDDRRDHADRPGAARRRRSRRRPSPPSVPASRR